MDAYEWTWLSGFFAGVWVAFAIARGIAWAREWRRS